MQAVFGRPLSAREIYRMDYVDGIVKSYSVRKMAYADDFVKFSREHPYWGNQLSIAGKLANV